MRLDTLVSELAGVGKTRAAKLNKNGIKTLYDLLYFFPRTYEDRGTTSLLGDFQTDESRSYILTIATKVSSAKLKGNLQISKFRAFDESGSVEIVFFNSRFVKDVFHVGSVFRFYGKTAFSKTKKLQLINPKYEPVIEGKPLDDLYPLYSTMDGLQSSVISKIIKTALNDALPLIEDYLPEEIRLRENLPSIGYALKNMHAPITPEDLERARNRLIFDELFFFGLGVSLSKEQRVYSEGFKFSPCSLKPLLELLPYDLTTGQKNAINDIYRDTVLRNESGITPAMSRILVGDVGCGKTICAIAALYICACSGYQGAMMVPTEILATQHYNEISELFSKLGIQVELLTGSTSLSRKRKIYEMLAEGAVDIVIGTHALLSDRVLFNKLGLIITDEQHRFGVAQRAVLKERSIKAHTLVMSATPIPRTLALALYGDLDITNITDMPKGRTPTDTYVVNEAYRARINDFIKKQVALGGQVYIVCPSIEETEEKQPGESDNENNNDSSRNYIFNNVIDHTNDLKRELPDLSIEYIHGKMSNSEKNSIMSLFLEHKIDVLVSTTVIEVGVNVPNASLIIIENAERFGLSQLHQLRGRVGRGSRKSYCILVSQLNTELSRLRLDVMKNCYDGFEIADRDLQLRGPGDIVSRNTDDSLRQSGGICFRFASLYSDKLIFERAFAIAKAIAAKDPTLSLPIHEGIKKQFLSTVYSPSLIS